MANTISTGLISDLFFITYSQFVHGRHKNNSGTKKLSVSSLEFLFVHDVISSAFHVRKRGPLLPFVAHGRLHRNTFFIPEVGGTFRRVHVQAKERLACTELE